MLQSLLSTIVETLLVEAGHAVAKMLGLESVVEFVTALAGLSFIVIGFAAWWMGH